MSSNTRTIICLFRNDLRIHDNLPLFHSHLDASHVLPVFCLDPREFDKTYFFKMNRMSQNRIRFLYESILDLKESLKKKGSDLLIKKGKPESVLPSIMDQCQNVSAIYLQKEVADEEIKIEKEIEKLCKVPVKYFWGKTLIDIEDLPFQGLSNIPDVFTQFRTSVEKSCSVKSCMEEPKKWKPLPTISSEEFQDVTPSLIKEMESLSKMDPRTAFPFKGGETSSLNRVKSYFFEKNLLQKYKDTRNGLVGSEYSSKLSPWLALGCISPRYIYQEISRYEQNVIKNESTYWLFFELLWRDYFQFITYKYGVSMFQIGGPKRVDKPWKRRDDWFEKWKMGKTGIPFIDANMRELLATGFQSNRGRQNVASFLTKNLELDWRLGAEWFEQQLIDHDVCSNYGNWTYSAGVGNDPREDRKFNIIKQANDYDPQGDYIRLWCPELSNLPNDKIHVPWTLTDAEQKKYQCIIGVDYPQPMIVDYAWQRIYSSLASSSTPVNRPKSLNGPKGSRVKY